MEPLFFLVFGLFLLVIVGAIQGMIAKARVGRLQEQVDQMAAEQRALRSELRKASEFGCVDEDGQGPARRAERESVPEPPTARAPEPASEPCEGVTSDGPLPPPIATSAVATSDVVPIPSADLVAKLASGSAASSATGSVALTEGESARPSSKKQEREPASSSPQSLEGVEQTLGLRWLTWLGVAMLFLGVAFFLKYAHERDWLGRFFGPKLRLTTSSAMAAGLAIAGWRSLCSGFGGLGQGLLGGGQALLYLTVFAAFKPALLVVDEPLIGPTTAFLLMALVTVLGLAVAVRLDAIAMAFLAVLGGFVAPVLVSSGQDSRDALCGYLLLLDVGVLGVALAVRHHWRALDLLAFAGTVLLFGGWYARWQHAHPQPDATLVWLLAFHLVFVLLPVGCHLRRRTPVVGERFALLLTNVVWSLGYAAWMLREPAPALLAAICLVAAPLYLVLGLIVARWVGKDAATRDGFFSLSILLLTLGLFYLLPVDAITSAWFVEAAALLFLGYRFGNAVIRHVAFVVLVAAVARTVSVHFPGEDLAAAFVWNGRFAMLLFASFGMAAFAWIHKRRGTRLHERRLARGVGIAAAYWLLLCLSFEILRHVRGDASAWPGPRALQVIGWIHVSGVLGFVAWSARWPHPTTFLAALAPLAIAGAAAAIGYGSYPGEAIPALNGCFSLGIGVCAAVLLLGRLARSQPGTVAARVGGPLFGLAQLLATGLLTLEVAAFLQRGDAEPSLGAFAQAIGWAWLAAAAGGGAVAATLVSRRVLVLALLPLAAAVVTICVTFVWTPAAYRLIANERFVFAMLVCLGVALLRPLFRWVEVRGSSGSPSAPDVASASALLLAMSAGCLEAIAWCRTSCAPGFVAGWAVGLMGATFVVASAGGAARARATGNPALRTVAHAALLPALLLPLVVYVVGWRASWMFVNARVGLVVAAITTASLWGREPSLRWLRWMAFAVALVALTAEPPTWLLHHLEDPSEARRLALFSVTVTWVLTAAALLFVGFRRDRRPVRLVALALLAVTAAKLLLLDMSGAQQLYRILAFVLVGIAFVGASWLYHRFERQLLARRE